MLERSIDEIIKEALEKDIFGPNFTFRKGQRETIETIVKTYQEDPESTVVIDAPTGTGKSIIAMWCSWILVRTTPRWNSPKKLVARPSILARSLTQFTSLSSSRRQRLMLPAQPWPFT